MRWFDRKYFDHAKSFWEPLANQGDCDAQYRMGTLYFLGTGTQIDYKKAHQWFSSAANQGQAFGQHLLAIMYAHSYTEISTPNAIMAFNCLKGCGYEKDMVAAYQWERLAERHTPYEPYREHVMKVMAEQFKQGVTADQLSKANHYIDAWQPSAKCEQRKVR
jgi:hypothetical protein